MKQEAPDADEKVSNEGNQKNGIMVMLDATPDSSVSKTKEEKICQRVHNLRQVESGIIILCRISMCCGDMQASHN